jgi:hypothetical protein
MVGEVLSRLPAGTRGVSGSGSGTPGHAVRIEYVVLSVGGPDGEVLRQRQATDLSRALSISPPPGGHRIAANEATPPLNRVPPRDSNLRLGQGPHLYEVPCGLSCADRARGA